MKQSSILCSYVLAAGDIILLTHANRAFEVLEEVEMIELNKVPYAGDQDKTCFERRLPRGTIISQRMNGREC